MPESGAGRLRLLLPTTAGAAGGTLPPWGVIQKHVCPSHWDRDQALTCLDHSLAPSQGRGLTVVELVVPVSILVEHGGILQDFDREGSKL
jgi:hypothetical protein